MDTLTLNPFVGDAYSMTTLSLAMQRLSYNTYSLLGDLGIFTPRPVVTTTIAVEERNGSLALVPTSMRGGPPPVNNVGKGKMRTFSVPHIALQDIVKPGEIQGIRAFGGLGVRTADSVLLDKLQTIKNKLDQTLEWHRVGAIKGVIYDADGSTVIYNLFNEFGMSPFTVNFNFSSATANIPQAILNVKRHMEDYLHGTTMSGVQALVDPNFYDALVKHPTIQVAYQYYLTNQKINGDYRTGFEVEGVTFREYRGTASDLTGTAHAFLAPNTAQFFPLGSPDTFITFYAPADMMEAVNTYGEPYYARQEPAPMGRGIEVYAETNPLCMCTRPELLVQGTMS